RPRPEQHPLASARPRPARARRGGPDDPLPVCRGPAGAGGPPALTGLLQLPCPFVGHYAHAELLCLLQLGLPEPRNLWDTWVHEKALYLGQNHKNYKLKAGADDCEEARAAEEAEEEDEFSFSLVSTCRRYGVSYPFTGAKERLQKSFLTHPEDAPFSEEQIEYAAADAVAVAALYQPQVLAATQAGTLQHL